MVPSSPSLFLALVALGPSLGAAHPSPEGAPGGTRPSATVSVTADLLPVEEARTSRLVKVITHRCPVKIRFHSYIDKVISPSYLLVGIISVMGKEGHAFEFDFSHVKLKTSS